VEHYLDATKPKSERLDDADIKYLEQVWGDDSVRQDVQSNRITLLPQNLQAYFVISQTLKIVRPDPMSGQYSDASIGIFAYLLCFMHGIPNPNETVDKVLDTFSSLSNKNAERMNEKNKPQTEREYVQ
jgi:hypothetical protein